MPRHNNKITPVNPVLPKPVINRIVPKSPSIVDTIKEGFGFGLGASIARKIVDAIPNTIIQTESKPNCFEYKKCLESDDKYECFGNLDQKEYMDCIMKIEK
jgi:hypothetical protein